MNQTSTQPPLLPVDPPTGGGDHRHWGSLPGSTRSLAILEASRRFPGLTLVITGSTDEAQALEQELAFYRDDEQDEALLSLPDWETLPYDMFSPHEAIISQRIRTLHNLPRMRRGLLVLPARTLMHRLPPPAFTEGNTLMLATGDPLPIDDWRQRLEAVGYRHADNVQEHGEYAVRGSILDIYPMGADLPYRIELFDDEVETLRTFDPETQRSIDQVERIELLPAHEFPWDERSRQRFRSRWNEAFPEAPREAPVYQDVAAGIRPPGIEYFLPLFFDETATLFDYLPEQSLVLTDPELQGALDHFQAEVDERYEERRYDRYRPILAPKEVFLRTEECFRHIRRLPRVTWFAEEQPQAAGVLNMPCAPLPDIALDARAEDPAAKLRAFMDERSPRVLFAADSAGRREALLEQLRQYGWQPREVDNWQQFQAASDTVGLCTGPLEHGAWLNEAGLCVIAEAELYGQRVMQRRRRQRATDSDTEGSIRDLSELRVGAPVVHIDHGIGRYQGLQTIEVDGQPTEFLTLQYANGANLYVPVSNLNLISRYSGVDDATAPLHRLGSEKWTQAKQKALEKVRDTAAELLDVYARREASQGHAFPQPDDAYHSFCAEFPFEETPDQMAAIEAVEQDMASERPMDRLICGDVGFGKTEVAMRAAFLATHAGKQVVVLVPTTLLAQQHYDSFRDRFAETGVRVELLSRFRSQKQQQATMARAAEGEADIIIGTHKLLQGDLNFPDLGLTIIDEEHRFGVNQKEKLKQLRAQVDVLTLTATPIPRTLNMAMGNLRDLSIIATPPARRLSVKTFVRRREDALVKEAILREILRGGQVYYLHNDVESIERLAEEVRALVPEARVGVAHGQMRERELEQIMSDFYHKRFNVLICTTIIETGIDIPSANTILIERADRFGLAQLHQLRGRVGRSHHQAYAYLLTPEGKKITGDAEKRLDAIAAAQDLGAGFMLATHDLEIRGAGELLGDDQSGQIQGVGLTLYMELLDEAVKAIREGRTPNADLPIRHGTEINLRIPALIPEDYLPDVHQRLILYKRLASTQSQEQLKELQVEIIDRFGLLPEPLKNLVRQTGLRIRAEALGISKVDAAGSSATMAFSADTRVDPLVLVELVQSSPGDYALESGDQLKFRLNGETADDRLNDLDRFLTLLEERATESKETQ
ncbi:transcription-repair coupling factor [Vreelandella utahensis]|uniref:transcription-repair coupling factor n=1 Tax=Vreelandella halophila TaxID=86177 RepID=UPI00098607C7|nr:transcription-repair coupling factor [Halomonas utahensis]